MADKNEIIKNVYIAYGFPSESRLYTLLNKDHKEITQDVIKKPFWDIKKQNRFINHIPTSADQSKKPQLLI